MTAQNPTRKADVVRLLLDTEGRVMLCLDATFPGVMVPRRFASDKGLRLILNRNMPQPIEIGTETIESELRFGGIPHYCVIPYDALWGVFNPDTQHGMFWAESMPDEILARPGLEEVAAVRLPEPEAPASPVTASQKKEGVKTGNRKPVALRVIEGNGAGEAEPAPKRPRPNLRLVN